MSGAAAGGWPEDRGGSSGPAPTRVAPTGRPRGQVELKPPACRSATAWAWWPPLRDGAMRGTFAFAAPPSPRRKPSPPPGRVAEARGDARLPQDQAGTLAHANQAAGRRVHGRIAAPANAGGVPAGGAAVHPPPQAPRVPGPLRGTGPTPRAHQHPRAAIGRCSGSRAMAPEPTPPAPPIFQTAAAAAADDGALAVEALLLAGAYRRLQRECERFEAAVACGGGGGAAVPHRE